jgi:hypothetical protein
MLFAMVFLSPLITLFNGIKLSEFLGLYDLNISAIMLLVIIAQYSYAILKNTGSVFSGFKNLMKNFSNESE